MKGGICRYINRAYFSFVPPIPPSLGHPRRFRMKLTSIGWQFTNDLTAFELFCSPRRGIVHFPEETADLDGTYDTPRSIPTLSAFYFSLHLRGLAPMTFTGAQPLSCPLPPSWQQKRRPSSPMAVGKLLPRTTGSTDQDVSDARSRQCCICWRLARSSQVRMLWLNPCLEIRNMMGVEQVF